MHTTTAQSSSSSAAGRNPKHVPGEPGVWVFILGDLNVFAVFFVYFLVQRMKQPDLFATSQEALNRNLGAINTVFLLISSLCVVLAVRAMRVAESVVAQRFIVGAVLCGIAFIVVKAFEYHERIAANELPSTNGFFMLYFVLTACTSCTSSWGWRCSRRCGLSRESPNSPPINGRSSKGVPVSGTWSTYSGWCCSR